MAAILSLVAPPSGVEPGGEGAITARLRNTGAVVDQFFLEVLGAAAAWSTVEPNGVSLFPGADAEVRIVLRPPKGPSAPAGTVPVGVRLRSAVEPSATVVEETSITVGAALDVAARLVPRTSKGASGAKHKLRLVNQGNAPTTVAIAASDPDEALVLRARPTSLTMPPGGRATVALRLRPRQRHWTGSREVKPFVVTVLPQGGQPVAVPGNFMQKPVVRGWLLMGAVAAVAILVAVLALHNSSHGAVSIIQNTKAPATGTPSASASAAASAKASAAPSAAASAKPAVPAGGAGQKGGSGGAGGSGSAPGSTPQSLSGLPGGVTNLGGIPGGSGGPPPPPAAPSIDAVVGAGGNLVRGAQVTAASGGGGAYDVSFAPDISNCAYTAVPGDPGGGGAPGGMVASVATANAHTVHVETKNLGGGVSGVGFHLSVVCDGAQAWTVVNYQGAQARGTATNVQPVGPGQYVVSFSRDVSGCAALASVGDPGIRPYVYAPAIVETGPGPSATDVKVEFRSLSDGQPTDYTGEPGGPGPKYPFHLSMLCSPDVAFAVVSPPSNVVHGTHGGAATHGRGQGMVSVHFDRDVSGCELGATLGAGQDGPRSIGTSLSPLGDPNAVDVYVQGAGGAGVDAPFAVVANC